MVKLLSIKIKGENIKEEIKYEKYEMGCKKLFLIHDRRGNILKETTSRKMIKKQKK